MSWSKFRQKYLHEQRQQVIFLLSLMNLVKKAQQQGLNVTLLCGENDYHGCHRHIIMEECVAIDKNFQHCIAD